MNLRYRRLAVKLSISWCLEESRKRYAEDGAAGGYLAASPSCRYLGLRGDHVSSTLSSNPAVEFSHCPVIQDRATSRPKLYHLR